jgi:aspartate/methionine/tyrosine aminotransferase
MFSDRTNWKLTRNRFTKALEEVRAAEREVLDLTIANPTRAGFDYDQAAILAALASPRAMDYDPQPKGLLEAREAVSGFYGGRHATTGLDPEQLILTTSTSEGYSYVFRLLCNPGDEVLIPKPSYPLFEFLADLQDVKLVPYPLLYDHGWQIDLPSIPKAVSPLTRAVVVVHPNNPTGSYIKPNERDTLNRFCAEHDLALVGDEVFLDYAHDGRSRSSLALNREVLTFTLSGLSKVSALPQMKVAWMVASGPEAQWKDAVARLEVIADTYLSMNAPIQWAVPILLEQRKSMQKQVLDRVLANLAELDRQLAARSRACQRLAVEGGWYAVLRVPVTGSDEDLTIELLRNKSVLVHPGHFYDFPGEGHLVLSLIGPNGDFAEGIRRVLEMVAC